VVFLGIPSPITEVKLTGHLTRAALEAALAGATAQVKAERYGLVINALEMDSYDLDARHAFVEWNRRERARVRGVAILTTKTLWHMVIAGMALASGQHMRPFNTVEPAHAWLGTL
jgi:hypothetical protein